MHLKSVTVRGFKTYRTETVIDLLSPHTNLILGKNGSGKSNLLDAIQFVLSDKYAGLTQDERRKLLHEGAGQEVAQADVELVFDNSQKRIPLEPAKGHKDDTDVRIRRTIGLKKDQILINGSPYSNADFQNLLESAGMSRSNPYYIVEQGKISMLMKQAKAQRLELFKEIAGTRTYDDRKKESTKIMKETDGKLKQIDIVIEQLEGRIKELEAESDEFKKYQALDVTRRSVEYSIYEQERESATAKLEAIDKKRSTGHGASEEQGGAHAKAQRAVKAAEEEIDQLQATSKKAQATKKGLTSQESALLKRRTELELEIKDLKERISGASGSKEEAAAELKTLAKKIKDAQAKLARLTGEFDGIRAEEEKLEIQYQRLDQRLADLASKRDRSGKYGSKKDRDADLKKQIARVTKQRAELAKQIEKLQTEMTGAQTAADRAAKDVQKKEEQVASNREAGDKINAQLVSLTQKRDDAINARKDAWKREADLTGEFATLKLQMEKATKAMQQSMSQDLYRGVEAARAIAVELGLDGVYGPLIELFTCNPEFHPCVEITAGNSLFHVVVDTDATASRVVAELLRRKKGRVTFIPLNKIHPQRPEYPITNDAMPMLSHLKYDAKFEKAMLQVFGKTLIARDLAIGAQLSSLHDLNTITLGGDRVDKKGALTGGFTDVDSQKSRLGAQQDLQEFKGKFEETEATVAALKANLKKVDADANRIISELQKLNEQKANLRSQNTQLTQEISQAKKENKALLDTITRNESLLPPLRASLASTETQLESYESEAKSDFRSGLSDEDEAELKRVTLEVEKLRAQLLKIRAQKAEVGAEKLKLESLLSANLGRREDELNARLNTATQEDDSDVLQRDEQELAQLLKQSKELDAEIKENDKAMEDANARLRTLQNDLDKLRAAESEAYAALSEDAKAMVKLMSQRTMFQQKKDEAIKKIRDLGALPNDAFDKYKDMSIKALFDRLEKTQTALKKYGGVNRKALEQYQLFTDQRTELIEKKAELDTGREAILDLIKHLDAKKDEAIERTFKTIAKHFSEVFAELVPGGKATLVMETRGLDGEEEEAAASEEEEEEESKEERKRPAKKKSKKSSAAVAVPTSAYTGISIKVSFTGISSHDMHQLSGGQESVVALSLIFAIQRCDPSPFYLLDEIDSALDPVHRTAVANMLKEQSKDTQFICTTFHPEMLAAADKCYGVVFKNKESTVQVITKEQAMRLIQVSEREAERE